MRKRTTPSTGDAVRKFQDDMRGLGLGVTISVPGREPVDVTAWLCPDCGAKRKDGATPCPTCGSTQDAVLR